MIGLAVEYERTVRRAVRERDMARIMEEKGESREGLDAERDDRFPFGGQSCLYRTGGVEWCLYESFMYRVYGRSAVLIDDDVIKPLRCTIPSSSSTSNEDPTLRDLPSGWLAASSRVRLQGKRKQLSHGSHRIHRVALKYHVTIIINSKRHIVIVYRTSQTSPTGSGACYAIA